MNLRNGDRNALSKPMALARCGATMPLEVVVVRRDGFNGEPLSWRWINLPDGVTASGLKIAGRPSRAGSCW